MIRRVAFLLTLAAIAHAQPDALAIRRLFDENLARTQREFGAGDARTAQAARDRAMFLERAGERAAARQAYRETVRIDDQALGPNAAQTLEDAGALAAMLPAASAAPLWARAANSKDASVAGPALSALAAIKKSAGDRTGAAALLRRAVTAAETVDGKDGQIVAMVLSALAAVAPAEEAIESLRHAVAIERKIVGPRDARTVNDARELAGLLRRAGRLKEAEGIEREFGIAGQE